MTKQKGFTPIAILIALAVLAMVVGVAVLQRSWISVIQPPQSTRVPKLEAGNTPTPKPITSTTAPTKRPTLQPSPTEKLEFPTDYSCASDSDCVLKDRFYCCGERLESYKWCYYKDIKPEKLSCEGVGSCPGIAGNASSCICRKGKCVAIF